MLNTPRISDTPGAQLYNRSDRVIINDEGYFYRTREQDLMGPFSTESEALFDLNVFLQVTEIEQELKDEFFLDVA
ncbi:MAG: DUF6316 family protein [Kangiellaceae bacterium]|nr:DUF6316 family protein [Kangiellaceae bacterium]MCW9000959.1 DUF6316 family protein [Kangiellaceae bacterium]